MKPTIEFLNARRESKVVSGGTNYAGRALSADAARKRRVDQASVFAGLDAIERAAIEVDALFADFRAWMRNRPSVQTIADGEDLEF